MKNLQHEFSELLKMTLTFLRQESNHSHWVCHELAIKSPSVPLISIPPKPALQKPVVQPEIQVKKPQPQALPSPTPERQAEATAFPLLNPLAPPQDSSSLRNVLHDISKFCSNITLHREPLTPKDLKALRPDILLVDSGFLPQEQMFMRHLEKALKSKGFSTVFSKIRCDARFTISTSPDTSFTLDPISSYLENSQKKLVLWKSLLRELNA